MWSNTRLFQNIVTRDPSVETTESNYGDHRAHLHDVICEFFLWQKSQGDTSSWSYNKPLLLGGIKRTPDITYQPPGKPTQYFEIKTSMARPSRDIYDGLMETARKQFPGLDVEPHIFVCDEKVPALFKLARHKFGVQWRNYYLTLMRSIKRYHVLYGRREELASLPPDRTVPEEDALPVELDLDYLKGPIDPMTGPVDMTSSDICDGVIPYLPVLEGALDEAVMRNNELADIIGADDNIPRLLEPSNPWDVHHAPYLSVFPVWDYFKGDTSPYQDMHKVETLLGRKYPALADIWSVVQRLRDTHDKDLDALHEIMKDIAFASQEITGKGGFTEILEKYKLHARPTLKRTVKALQNHADGIRQRINKDLVDVACKIDKTGMIRTNMTSELAMEAGLQKKSESKPVVTMKEDTPLGDIWHNYTALQHDLTPRKIPDFPSDNLYPNPQLASISKQACKESMARIKAVMETPKWEYINRQQQFIEGYTMAVEKSRNKKSSRFSFTWYQVPGMQSIVIATRPINDIATGALQWIAHGPPGIRPKEGEIRFEEMPVDDAGSLYISQPFRLPWRWARKYGSMAGSYVGNCLFALNNGSPLHTSDLYWSVYLKHSRNVTYALDLWYNCVKRANSRYCLGAKVARKKMRKGCFKDIRAYTFMRLCKDYFAPQLGMLEPPFVIPHLNVHVPNYAILDLLIYFKNVIPENDGADEAKYLFNFAKDDCDLEVNWRKSPFHDVKYNELQTVPQFMEHLTGSDSDQYRPVTYTAPAYFNTAIWAKGNEECASFVQRFPEEAGKTIFRQKSITSSKAKKVLVPVEGYPEELGPKPGSTGETNYPGVFSVGQKEAMLKHLLRMEEFCDSNDLSFGEEEPTLWDVANFCCLLYPKLSFTIMKLKDQHDYKLRCFFIQMFHNLVQNKCADWGWRRLLEKTEEDMLARMGKGTEKMKNIEECLRNLHAPPRSMTMSEDQTRYGDDYVMAAFEIMARAAFNAKYFTTVQFKYLMHVYHNLKHRLVFLPFLTARILESHKGSDLKSRIEAELEPYKALFSDPEWDDINFGVWGMFQLIKFQRTNGWILGAQNTTGSLLSAYHLQYTKEILGRLGLTNIVDGRTHSDDAFKATSLPVPNDTMFRKYNVDFPEGGYFQSVVRHWEEGHKLVRTGDVFTWYDGETALSPLNPMILSKLVMALAFFCPRMVGQTPSDLKYTIGETAEVLQVRISSQGVDIPLIRYTANLFAELPGKSPSDDLINAIGRMTGFLREGGDLNTAHDFIILANIVMSRKFSSPMEVAWLPPSMGGVWYGWPAFALDHGWQLNLYRMLSWASADSHTCDRQLQTYYRRSLIYGFKTRHFWKFKADLATEIAIENIPDRNEAPEVEGNIPEVFADFKIRYTRKSKAFTSFEYLATLYRPKFQKYADRVFDGSDDLKFYPNNEFIKKFKMASISTQIPGHPEFIPACSYALAKYLSPGFQEAYAKPPMSFYIVSQHGYMDRKVWFPFAKLNGPRKCTLRHVRMVFKGAVMSGEVQIPDGHVTAMIRIYQPIIQCLNHTRSFYNIQTALPATYRFIKYEPFYPSGDTELEAKCTISLAIRTANREVTYSAAREVFGPFVSMDAINTKVALFTSLVKEMGIQVVDIPMHYDLLVSMMGHRKPSGIAKVKTVDLADSVSSNAIPYGQRYVSIQVPPEFVEKHVFTYDATITRKILMYLIIEPDRRHVREFTDSLGINYPHTTTGCWNTVSVRNQSSQSLALALAWMKLWPGEHVEFYYSRGRCGMQVGSDVTIVEYDPRYEDQNGIFDKDTAKVSVSTSCREPQNALFTSSAIFEIFLAPYRQWKGLDSIAKTGHGDVVYHTANDTLVWLAKPNFGTGTYSIKYKDKLALPGCMTNETLLGWHVNVSSDRGTAIYNIVPWVFDTHTTSQAICPKCDILDILPPPIVQSNLLVLQPLFDYHGWDGKVHSVSVTVDILIRLCRRFLFAKCLNVAKSSDLSNLEAVFEIMLLVEATYCTPIAWWIEIMLQENTVTQHEYVQFVLKSNGESTHVPTFVNTLYEVTSCDEQTAPAVAFRTLKLWCTKYPGTERNCNNCVNCAKQITWKSRFFRTTNELFWYPRDPNIVTFFVNKISDPTLPAAERTWRPRRAMYRITPTDIWGLLSPRLNGLVQSYFRAASRQRERCFLAHGLIDEIHYHTIRSFLEWNKTLVDLIESIAVVMPTLREEWT